MSDSTERFALPFILPGQAQKEAFHNEALTAIDMMLHPAVELGPLDTPPLLPDPGRCWIVGSAPTGEWEMSANCLAMWTQSGWRYASPAPGLRAWNIADNCDLYWNGMVWTPAIAVGSVEIEGEQVVGARQPAIANPLGGTVIDVEARAALTEVIAALMTHGLID